MNNEYKVIPWEEVKIGQELEQKYHQHFSDDPWVKMSETNYACGSDSGWDGAAYFSDGCLVRTADCEPIKRCWEGGTKATCDCPDCGTCLVDYTETPEERKVADDFDTWWDTEAIGCYYGHSTKDACKAAWFAATGN